ncbi:uncharacterized protein LOC121425590 [Lytechinus variegatus]|uniref:uncharacterized protein LOC121425590 n=1 Tax=Lytechinus variegatus TaxID=7654 RepID=UPI001BB0E32E|nr:uncharacterized protein LOC121425590 [Lytechinus variegatus]
MSDGPLASLASAEDPYSLDMQGSMEEEEEEEDDEDDDDDEERRRHRAGDLTVLCDDSEDYPGSRVPTPPSSAGLHPTNTSNSPSSCVLSQLDTNTEYDSLPPATPHTGHDEPVYYIGSGEAHGLPTAKHGDGLLQRLAIRAIHLYASDTDVETNPSSSLDDSSSFGPEHTGREVRLLINDSEPLLRVVDHNTGAKLLALNWNGVNKVFLTPACGEQIIVISVGSPVSASGTTQLQHDVDFVFFACASRRQVITLSYFTYTPI